MTITSTGPSGFHLKPLVTIIAAAAIVTGVFAIAQTVGTDSQPGVSAPADVSAEAAEPYAGPSGSSEALAAGKFDAGLVSEPSPAITGSEPAPEIVVIERQGSRYDALVEGKYDLDFAPGDPAVQYVLVPAAATGSSSQLVEGVGDGPFTELSPTAGTAGHTPTVSGGPQE